jgi:LuxR family maltose regulon positive regulatory protein
VHQAVGQRRRPTRLSGERTACAPPTPGSARCRSAVGDEARRIYRIGVHNGSADETLARLGYAPNRRPGERGAPLRRAACESLAACAGIGGRAQAAAGRQASAAAYDRAVRFALSKIQPPGPRRGTLLARPALEQRLLDALLDRRVVFVQAPAGYGKTALLVRALAQLPAGRGAAWVSLDPGDDLHRLLECLLAALEAFDLPWRVAPEAILATAAQGSPRGRQQAVDDLVNALEACELAHGAIVIDDLHHLDDDDADHFLLRLVERLGRRWTLVLASRHEPPFSLARIAAAGELAELRQADLQFTPDEVRTLFAQVAEPGAPALDDAAVAALHARTGGWAAGLRLALNGARGTVVTAAGSAIDRQAFDYLAEEVLARIPADLREFLVTTSVLHELDEPRCRALTGDPRAAAWLDEIERRGLFATFVEGQPTPTLRLHDLFREALLHCLRVERGAVAVTQLLERAAASEPDAVRRLALLLRAGRHDAAAVQLRALGWELLFQGGVPTLLRLVEQFPAAAAEGSAEVQGVLGLARWHQWEARVAERHFARAEALYAERGDAAGSAAMRGYRAVTLALQGRVKSAR